MNENASYYRTQLRRPSWAPPSWVFGPVWTLLYILIALSFGTVFIKTIQGSITFFTMLPFLLNLIFNILYTPIEFGLKNNILALVDIFLTLGTIIWCMVAIYPLLSWVVYINLPYLLWVSFATVLQIAITIQNR